MDVVKERIKQVRGELTYEQLAKELTKSGLPFGKAIIWRYENEEGLYPGFGYYYAVAKILNINLNWLITGEGPMLVNYKGGVPKQTSNTSKTRHTSRSEVSKSARK